MVHVHIQYLLYKHHYYCNSCTAGSDSTSSPITVVFFAGETIAQARVPITDDSIVEDTEHFTAVMTSTNPNVVIGDDTVTVTILDNNCEWFVLIMYIHSSILSIVAWPCHNIKGSGVPLFRYGTVK